MKYILSIDQSTQSTSAVLYSESLTPLFSGCRMHTQIYPKPGWVEHDAEEIWQCMKAAVRDVLGQAEKSGISPKDIESIGIANQGETVVAWDSETGKPVCNAIVWQCSRTSEMAEELKNIPGLEESVHQKTGLFIDPYFSATKIKWLLENVPGAEEALRRGTLMAGTLDSFFIYKMTGGKVFATDASTASRTMLFNINSLEWDEDILKELGIPKDILADVRPTCSDFGTTESGFCGLKAKITASAVDQQAALFGHRCFEKGDIKCTYGTGCFMLMNVGNKPAVSKNRLLTTIAWQIGSEVTYALDGGVYIAGAAFKWLKDTMKLIKDYGEIEEMALRLKDNGGVYFVTAFTGLGAPHWDRHAKGMISGLNLSSTKEHIVRAVCESIAFGVNGVLGCMMMDTGGKMPSVRVDGGVSKSRFLMQFQADISGMPLKVSDDCELTSLGVAMLSGIGSGRWEKVQDIPLREEEYCEYMPSMGQDERNSLLSGWSMAVKSCIGLNR